MMYYDEDGNVTLMMGAEGLKAYNKLMTKMFEEHNARIDKEAENEQE